MGQLEKESSQTAVKVKTLFFFLSFFFFSEFWSHHPRMHPGQSQGLQSPGGSVSVQCSTSESIDVPIFLFLLCCECTYWIEDS